MINPDFCTFCARLKLLKTNPGVQIDMSVVNQYTATMFSLNFGPFWAVFGRFAQVLTNRHTNGRMNMTDKAATNGKKKRLQKKNPKEKK